MDSIKLIARGSMATPLAVSEDIQYGLGQLTNEGPTTEARVLFKGDADAADVDDVMLGARLYPRGGNQTQTQNEQNGGTRLEWVWLAVCPDHAVAPGATVAAEFADVLLVGTNNRAVKGKRASLMASFTQPNVAPGAGSTVQITVSDSTVFAVNDTVYVEGGTICTVVSVNDGSDPTKMTIANTGEAATTVTLCES